jgi:5-methylcytosine-specific restriction endonuclease McrA
MSWLYDDLDDLDDLTARSIEDAREAFRLGVTDRLGPVCHYCYLPINLTLAHVDHMPPRSGGGGNEPENLAFACAPCNLSKGARTESEWIDALGSERSVHLIGVIARAIEAELAGAGSPASNPQ